MKITIAQHCGGHFSCRKAGTTLEPAKHPETGLIYADSEIDVEKTIEHPGAYEIEGGGIAIDGAHWADDARARRVMKSL